MKVKAIREGFYAGSRRRAGDEFEVPEGAKARWFAPVKEAPTEPKPAKPDKGKLEKGPTGSRASDQDVI